ncbi:MAG: hypothetical protein ACD_4C00018G0003 [uncultured bacterium (gcode 4)]|uniref:Uncharacterized protein n=1 Tax=uncultured bacterium (gcode 4) TaxID=1234023 RepID=K2GAM2_9BACT|nr:MAG: hypothetical protein ACD_4C00018G0003 [uncultured bacterium (gcode 4)]
MNIIVPCSIVDYVVVHEYFHLFIMTTQRIFGSLLKMYYLITLNGKNDWK